ncbi:hypothetical protein GMORB2_3013 [Geosmithia morbida]|uniref:Integral membrane protein n=1 Tax=Geosmithia morbida TaxID=1094350 RepID=A0A9P5D287_9HYPO|nr:uncharacterized protein GMORB2_3013 [Geosmithia morbida]KAF4120575.1 hypothetical protein GMORB2_3013 [Geosmithia morbida]
MSPPSFSAARPLLLVAPLVSSTASLLFAWDQHLFLSLLAHPTIAEPVTAGPEPHAGTNALLPPYFRRFFRRGLGRVVTFLAVTTWSSLGAVHHFGPLLRSKGSLGWYVGAASLAVGHLLFVPAVAYPIKSISENEGGGVEVPVEDAAQKDAAGGGGLSNIDHLNRWLRVNLVRTLTTDTGAWICAVTAVTKTFTA